MLTFESTDKGDRLEIHGDKAGLLKLAKILIEMADESSAEHRHLMTDDWGGSGLTNVKQGEENSLFHHVKILFWPK